MADHNQEQHSDNERVIEREKVIVDNDNHNKKSSNPLGIILAIIAILFLLAFLAFVFDVFKSADDGNVDIQVPTPSVDINTDNNSNNTQPSNNSAAPQ